MGRVTAECLSFDSFGSVDGSDQDVAALSVSGLLVRPDNVESPFHERFGWKQGDQFHRNCWWESARQLALVTGLTLVDCIFVKGRPPITSVENLADLDVAREMSAGIVLV